MEEGNRWQVAGLKLWGKKRARVRLEQGWQSREEKVRHSLCFGCWRNHQRLRHLKATGLICESKGNGNLGAEKSRATGICSCCSLGRSWELFVGAR